jgi:two-component system NarL family sensor kinase
MDTQEARIYTAVIIAVVVVGIIIIFFAASVIRQQRKNIELQKANALAEICAMEKERARIAADLHDELGPVLSVIKFRVDHVDLASEEKQKELRKASSQLDELIDRLREVSNNLMPVALQRKGLTSALEEFINNINRSHRVHIDFLDNSMGHLSEEKTIHVYRIVQEIIHNCLKHASASRASIRFKERNGYLRILYMDNGKGFDVEKVSAGSNGVGLRSIRNRTDMMGGRIEIESEPGKGTLFNLEIPVK